MDIKNAIEMEMFRQQLSSLGKLKLLIDTYSTKYPSISNNNTGNFWDKNNFINRYSNKSNPMAMDRIKTVAGIIKNTSKYRKSNCLDIGFGPADLEQLLYKTTNKCLVYGIDISITSVNKASNIYSKYKFIYGDILKIPYKNTTFDIVVALEVLEHVSPSDTFLALKEVYRVLKQNGIFITSVPLNEGLEKLLASGKNPNKHVRIYSIDLIKAELKLSGFKVKKSKLMYAFHNQYQIKKIVNFIFHIRKPNNIIILAQKI